MSQMRREADTNVTVVKYDQTFHLRPRGASTKVPSISRKRLRHDEYDVFYEHQHLGIVRKFRSEWNTEHWAYQSADQGVRGKKGQQIADAVWELFDKVIRQPISRAERDAETAKYYQPPLVIDGITFAFEFEQVISTDDVSKALRYSVTFPSCIDSSGGGPVWRNSHDRMVRYQRQPHHGEFDLWTTSYSLGSATFYNLEHVLPLEYACRWLYLHEQYVSVRCVRELECYNHSIMRLIEEKHGLCSEDVYRELLGFRPITDTCWKVYQQTEGRLVDGNYVVRDEHYELVKQGSFEDCQKAYEQTLDSNRRIGCILLLAPDNRLAKTFYPSSQRERIMSNWTSIFGEGDHFWRLTPWEQALADIEAEKARAQMERFAKTLMPIESIDTTKKPN